MRLEAAARIGNAITLPEIPAKYKKYKLLNRGTTSIILEKDENSVFVLTRDSIKTEWFDHSAIAKFVEQIDNVGYTRFRELPIYVYEMPKLQPIGKGKIKEVNEIIKEFDNIQLRYASRNPFNKPTLDNYKLMNALSRAVEEHDLKFNKPHALADFISFIVNYDENQYNFDMRRANFMQDNKGNIVLVDPIVSKEIMNILRPPNKYKMFASQPRES